MNKKLSRKEFLKLAGLLPLAYYLPKTILDSDNPKSGDLPNILIFVMDALSARNISLHGYQRETMPNLMKIIDRATVFHRHYSGGNFTTPGTATLLTGTYPWTHRGYKSGKPVHESVRSRNIFNLLGTHNRISYSHNPLVNTLQEDFIEWIDHYTDRNELTFGKDRWYAKLFNKDFNIASIGWRRNTSRADDGMSYSLVLSNYYNSLQSKLSEELIEQFPRGLPEVTIQSFFTLEQVLDWTLDELKEIPQPFMGYFHYLPPHKPYNTRKDFINVFKKDGLETPEKPIHLFGNSWFPFKRVSRNRQLYDEFILYADAEFYRFYQNLEENGLLENTWIILTSDHGEMFERGVLGHMTQTMYEPLIHIPLVIFEPGQTKRKDVYQLTSATDILPTCLEITGQDIPNWVEGEVLPPYRKDTPDPQRSVYSVEAKYSGLAGPLRPVSSVIIKEKYKLIYYAGYIKYFNEDYLLELYDLENDPEEMNDLSTTHPELANELLDELLTIMSEANDPYA